MLNYRVVVSDERKIVGKIMIIYDQMDMLLLFTRQSVYFQVIKNLS